MLKYKIFISYQKFQTISGVYLATYSLGSTGSSWG